MRSRPCIPADFAWLEERAGCVLTRKAQGFQALDDSGRVRGMIAYDEATETETCCHIALESPAALRCLLPSIFRFPFLFNGFDNLLAKVVSTNKRSIRLVQHFGFREVYRRRGGVRAGVDLILFELRRADCRYLSHERKAA